MYPERVIISILIVGAITILFIVRLVKYRARIRKHAHGATKDRTNYNLDVRRFIKEALRKPIWVTVGLVGLVLALLPVMLNQELFSLSAGLVICWVLILIAVAGVVMGQINHDDLALFAKRQGLQYARNTPSWFNNLTFAQTVLLHKSKAPAIEGLLHANTSAGEVWIFRYSFEHKANKLSRAELYQYSVLSITTHEKKLPEFAIDNKKVYDFKEFIAPLDYQPISLEGSFGLTHRLLVEASDDTTKRLLALSVMTPDVMELYERYFSDCCMVIENGTVIILTRRDIYEDQAYESMYEGVCLLVEKIARQVKLRQSVGKLQKP